MASSVGVAPVLSDDRPAVLAETPPPPISGGTLLVSVDGRTAVVADAARDRVIAVDLESKAVRWTHGLSEGAWPGRIAQSAAGYHIALRGSGQVLTLDELGEVAWQTDVCADPSGVAVSAARGEVLVACRDGRLLALDGESGASNLLARLDVDLRDVVVVPPSDANETMVEQVYVTRFRSAEVLRLGEDFSVGERVMPVRGFSFETVSAPSDESGAPTSVVSGSIEMQPAVGWRAVPADDGIAFLHQRGRTNPIDISGDTAGSSYGGGVDCSPIVGPAVTFVGGQSLNVWSSVQLRERLLVDIAVNDQWVAVAEAGSVDPVVSRQASELPQNIAPSSVPAAVAPSPRAASLHSQLEHSGDAVPVIALYPRGDLPQSSGTDDGVRCSTEAARVTMPEYNQAVAVAFNEVEPSQLVALLREPSALLVVDLETGGQLAVPLGGKSVRDTGHDLFHQATPSGIACASCHPEGGEDGRVWNFEQLGPRRTQSLEVGLQGTEPLHWDGEFSKLSDLMSDVFVQRMGGARQGADRIPALQRWMFTLEPPAPLRPADDELAQQGKALFESPEVGCSTCHRGEHLTDNASYDVGTAEGAHLQVPSLVGVGYRAPLMHDGCAVDLWARFEPSCGGGDSHGRTSQLTLAQVDAIVAYMESL